MPVETCGGCGKRMDWGPLFNKRSDKTRVCPYCKEDFDQPETRTEFNMGDFMKKQEGI